MNRRQRGGKGKTVDKLTTAANDCKAQGQNSSQRSRTGSPGMKYSKKLKTQLLREFFQRGFLNPTKSFSRVSTSDVNRRGVTSGKEKCHLDRINRPSCGGAGKYTKKNFF